MNLTKRVWEWGCKIVKAYWGQWAEKSGLSRKAVPEAFHLRITGSCLQPAWQKDGLFYVDQFRTRTGRWKQNLLWDPYIFLPWFFSLPSITVSVLFRCDSRFKLSHPPSLRKYLFLAFRTSSLYTINAPDLDLQSEKLSSIIPSVQSALRSPVITKYKSKDHNSSSANHF